MMKHGKLFPVALLLGALLAVLTACGSDVATNDAAVSVDSNISDSTGVSTGSRKDNVSSNSETESAEADSHDVILSADGNEYILTGDDADFIFDLFYVHEKEVNSSPCDCLEYITFQIGEDRLDITESLGDLHGKLGGEFVTVKLSENEEEVLRKLISRYVILSSD